MLRIDKLTFGQESFLPEYKDRWLKIGLSTSNESLDVRGVKQIIDRVYKEGGLKAPDYIVSLDSPLAGCVGAAMLDQVQVRVRTQVRNQVESQVVWDQVEAQIRAQVENQVEAQVEAQVRAQVRNQVEAQVRNQVESQVWDQVGDQVRNQVEAQVWDQVGDQVRAQVWNQVRELAYPGPGEAQVRDQVWNQIGDQVRDQVRDQIWDQVGWNQVRDQVRDQIWDQVGDQVEAQVRDQVGNQVGNQVWNQVQAQVHKCGYGIQDADWLSFYSYILEVLELEQSYCSKLVPLMELSQEVGWWWPFENTVIVTPKPILLKRDEQNRLHCEDGPAIQYPDGWGVWAWHGVRVGKEIIEQPSTITCNMIEAQSNAEIRRVLMQRYGLARYLVDSGAQQISIDQYGILYQKNIPGDVPLTMVRVKNSTPEQDGVFKEYFLRVPPNTKTALEAVAWTFGIEPKDYASKVET